MENGLGVSVADAAAFEDEVECGLKSDAVVEIRGHRAIGWIAGILIVDDRRHSLEGFDDLIAGQEAVMEPVGDVLT